MTRNDAAGYEDYAEAPSDRAAQKAFRDQGQRRMMELAGMAIAAHRANEEQDAQRCELKISIIKAAFGQTLPTAQHISELRVRKDKATERFRNTRARMTMLAEQENAVLDELERLKELIQELEEQYQDDDIGEAAAAGAAPAHGADGAGPGRQGPPPG